MKIIKEGNPKARANVVRRFECRTCGCVFDADGDEYEVVKWYVKDVVEASSICPMCGEVCAHYIRAEKS